MVFTINYLLFIWNIQVNKNDMPTNLTIACFLPNPDADIEFSTKQGLKQGDAWIIPREEIGDKVIS